MKYCPECGKEIENKELPMWMDDAVEGNLNCKNCGLYFNVVVGSFPRRYATIFYNLKESDS